MQRSILAGSVVVGIAVTSVLAAAPVSAAITPPPLSVVRPASPLIDMPTSYPVQPELKVFPDLPTDASIARGVRPYDEIAPFLNTLMDSTDRVSAQVVGLSAQGRDIYLVTVTAPETAAETAQQGVWRDRIKADPIGAAADVALQSGYKVPMWFNGNIHGNEWEGTDATLNYIEDLATSTDPATTEMLDEHRIYFTVTNNPDGRALGQRGTANGYDPNRDFITGATAEASLVRDLAGVIQPTYFIDLHGYTSVLQVEPCGPPHGENYEYDLFVPHAYATALEIEDAVTAANIPGNTYYDPATDSVTETNTGFINIPYRDQRSGWDDWPPIFAPQYVAYQGAITNTVELPLGRSGDQPARAKVNIAVAEVVIDTVVDYVGEHSDALLDNQIEIFRRGTAGEPSVEIPADVAPEDLAPGVPAEWTDIWDETDVYNADFPRAYVIPVGAGQRSDSDAQTLVQQLLVNGIQVERLTAAARLGGTDYPAGSYYVDMHQPLRGLANVLLADGSDISDRVPDMYDISAWSLALLWGADVARIGETTDAAPVVVTEDVTSAPLTGSVPEDAGYLTFEPRGVADWQAVNALLAEGIALSQLTDGTIVVGADEASRTAAAEAAAIFGVDFALSDGTVLLDEDSTALRRTTVGYVGDAGDRDALVKLGFTGLVPVTAAALAAGQVDLATVDLLYVGTGLSFSAEQAAGADRVRAFIAAGKPVVGRGAAGTAFVNTFVSPLTAVTGTSGSNGIARVETPEDGVLGDYAQDTAFGYPFAWFPAPAAGVTVEQRYAASDTFVSGHWRATDGRAVANAAGQASAVSLTGASGTRAFVFGTSPTFRAHPVGAFGDVARAVFWAAGEGVSVVPPVEEPPTEEPPTEEPPTEEPPVEEPPVEETPAPVEPTPTPAPTSTPIGLPAGGSDDDLAVTGGQDPAPLGWAALAVGLVGAGLIVIGRARRTSRAQ
ncbi:M14 family zinc carboxypeptidase [Microbacterium sp. LMI1-1-1.1]|uniref:M14 family zinc carboxypeptidase n=1 Tax=Microbacterium sp. LMI1-1-1.1 TaxID=3135223 RepID=UPI003465BCD1